MAISHSHILLFSDLRLQNVVGAGRTNRVLELGEQNWHVLNLDYIRGMFAWLFDRHVSTANRHTLDRELAQVLDERSKDWEFALVKLFYRVVLDYEQYQAIDLHGTANAWRFNLNHPIAIRDQYDLVTNLGTAEHVFNQQQFFKTMHDVTRPDGLMIHSFPNQGCYDHGFFNYHPTFVFDLCEANNYHLGALMYADCNELPPKLVQITDRAQYVKLAVDAQLSQCSGLMAVIRKGPSNNEFKIPQQAYYDDRLPAELADAWRNLPH